MSNAGEQVFLRWFPAWEKACLKSLFIFHLEMESEKKCVGRPSRITLETVKAMESPGIILSLSFSLSSPWSEGANCFSMSLILNSCISKASSIGVLPSYFKLNYSTNWKPWCSIINPRSHHASGTRSRRDGSLKSPLVHFKGLQYRKIDQITESDYQWQCLDYTYWRILFSRNSLKTWVACIFLRQLKDEKTYIGCAIDCYVYCL